VSPIVLCTADETTDIQGRCLVNIIVGTLFSQQPSEQFLISSTFHNTVNAEKLCEKIIKALQHNYECDVSKVLLFVSDAASVMLKTGKLLKNYFPNMLHLTCFGHGLHRICEFIRDSFPDINSLISLFKKNLLKSPSTQYFIASATSIYHSRCFGIRGGYDFIF
jgi:hypothetical protein